VFLIAPDNRKVSLVNGAGQRLRQYQVEGPTNPNGVSILFPPNLKQPPIKVGPHLYLASSVHLHPSDPQFYALARVVLRLDITTGQVELAGSYPDLYRQPGRHYPGQWVEPGHTSNGKTLVVSFSADQQVYQYALPALGSPQAHLAASSHFGQVPHHPRPLEGMAELEMAVNSPFFEGIHYLPGQKQYHRLAYLPDPKTPFSAANPKAPFYPDYLLIVLDENFQKMGEGIIPREVNRTHWVVAPDGLYGEVSGETEDELVLRLLRPVVKHN
jgi:Domain of unknown function (DUF4221)